MADDRPFTYPDRPQVVRDADGNLSNPEGWSLVLVAPDAETIVAAWDDAGAFWQWEDTETIVKDLIDALAMTQQALTAVTQ
jgi:hypothetical protein